MMAITWERKQATQVIYQVAASAQPGDVVVVMGARDNSLTSVAQKILRSLQNKTAFSLKKMIFSEEGK